ncbi:hypothetical protein GALL_528630 [mine drainage metagenome]|uniref:Uncharacterized protein n=1 Tax=mine drainage metagenome TaxID=410659 RepID=A0A1J5P203_9ZZZZ
MIFAEIQKFKNIRMPWFQVNSEGAFALTAALVDITGGIVKYTQHRDNPIAGTIGAADV